jgi:membrane-bound lytic murein transglycosylase F
MILIACSGDSEKKPFIKLEAEEILATPEDPISRDLEQITADGVLKAITLFSPTSYFLYRGQPLGFEYELLQKLADHLGLKLEIVVAENMKMVNLLNMLNTGEGDIIAHGLTVTEKRKEYVKFTHRHFESYQVLVQRKPANWRNMKLHNIEEFLITNPLDLIGKVVYVRDRSSYHQRLHHLQEEMGGKIIIKPVDEDISTSEIIKKVVDGEFNYTVADNNIAAINATYYSILDINTAISFPQQIAWAVRLNSPDLLQAVNSWIDAMKTEADYNVIYNKYFENQKLFKKHVKSEYYSLESGKISEYDDLIKKHAVEIGWDWRLLSALIFQESMFDPQATSWAGGQGLMQLMPATAEELGVSKRSDPAQSIQGGTTYLEQLYGQWEDIPDTIQRIKFTMASYNCGYHHVLDAQRLAARDNSEQLIWDDEIENYILLLSSEKYYQDDVVKYGYCRGEEPYEYVREIFERFDQYKQFIP